MKINGQPEGGQGGGLTPAQEALINQVPNKVNQVRLVTDGSAIRHEGALTPLTFEQIYALVMDNSKYVYIVMDNNIRFRPSAYDGDAIWFDSSFIEEGKPNILRCIINSDNRVDITQIVVASEEYVDEKVAEAGGLDPEQKKAVETLVDSKKGMLYTNIYPSLSSDVIGGFYGSDPRYFRNMPDGEPIFYTPNYTYIDVEGGYYLFHINDDLTSKVVFRSNGNSLQHIWKDMSGRYYNNSYYLNPETNEFEYKDLGYSPQFTGYRSSLFVYDGELYNINWSIISKFNEDTQRFEQVETNWSDYVNYEQSLEYEGRLLFNNDNNVFEFTVVDGVATIQSVESPFPYIGDFIDIHNIGGDLYYLPYYGTECYKLVNGEWNQILTSGYSFDRHGVVVGNLALGFNASIENRVWNFTGNEIKFTHWVEPTSTGLVDTFSSQRIEGNKTFSQITVESNINTSYINGSRLNINGDEINITTQKSISLNGNTEINGVKAVTVDEIPINSSVTYIGTKFKAVTDDYVTYGHSVILHNSVPYYFMYNDSKRFTGTSWESVDFGFSDYGEGRYNFLQTSDRTFFANPNDGRLYEFDGTQFIDRVEASGTMFPLGDTLVNTSGLRLNTDTWTWESSEVPSYPGDYHRIKVIGGETYYFDYNNIQKYNSDTNSFEILTTTSYWDDYGRIFIYDDEIYIISDGFWKFNPVDNTVVKSDNIYVVDYNNPYFEYDGKLYVSGPYGKTGYCYDTTYTKPEVPESDGTYVLKATRVGDQITYTWVVE